MVYERINLTLQFYNPKRIITVNSFYVLSTKANDGVISNTSPLMNEQCETKSANTLYWPLYVSLCFCMNHIEQNPLLFYCSKKSGCKNLLHFLFEQSFKNQVWNKYLAGPGVVLWIPSKQPGSFQQVWWCADLASTEACTSLWLGWSAGTGAGSRSRRKGGNIEVRWVTLFTYS